MPAHQADEGGKIAQELTSRVFEVSRFIKVRASVVGFHRWKDAPEDVAFLRDWHRHVFQVTLSFPVGHGNRQLEFFQQQRKLQAFLDTEFKDKRFEASCEQMAERILFRFHGAAYCTVSEDGENEGQVMRTDVRGTDVKAAACPAEASAGPPRPDPREVATKVRDRPFVGIEVEGPDAGRPTLFLPGSVTPSTVERLRDSLLSTPNLSICRGSNFVYRISPVYYGAGNDRKVSREIVDLLLKLFPDNPLTVECEEVPDWFDHPMYNWVRLVALRVPGKPKHATRQQRYWKEVTDDKVCWRVVEYTYSSSLTDPRYATDQELSVPGV